MMTLHACEKETEISFVIKTEGFRLENGTGLKGENMPPFTHHILGGVVYFSGNQDVYRFDLREENLETYVFSLPAGRYEVDFSMSPASAYGQDLGSFIAETEFIEIDEASDTLLVRVNPNCSLFLVDDRNLELENGAFMIKRHSYSEGYFTSHPFKEDEESGLLYTYFNPDPRPADPSAFVWFYHGRPGEEEGGLSTCDMKSGFEYYIKILD